MRTGPRILTAVGFSLSGSSVAIYALLVALATLSVARGRAGAQLIPVRTVPVASGDQGLMLPAATLGMAGVTLAVDDSLMDPWADPAKGVLIRESALLGSPTFYGISNHGGSGRTFPVAAFFRSGKWFGGGALALQQVSNDDGERNFVIAVPEVDACFSCWPPQADLLSDRSSPNYYGQAFLGRRLNEAWSVGGSLALASLDALDGVDLLYPAAERIQQSGSSSDVRLGLYRNRGEDHLELMVIRNRFDMTHHVTYVDRRWDEVAMTPEVSWRTEVNEDRTRTWGLHTAYDRALRAPGWRLGLSGTVNRKSHPRIPNYDLQNIPRDPGTTWAYDFGVGLSKRNGPSLFGVDVVFEPIWSDTWQVADRATPTADEGVIPKGRKSIENEFFFTNVKLRIGVAHRVDHLDLQAGVEVRSYDYTLKQRDHVAVSFRKQDESWMEWTPSVGAALHLDGMELRYAGRLTTGTGRPGVATRFEDAVASPLEAGGDFIVAPRAPLTLRNATVVTHQLAVVIPIR